MGFAAMGKESLPVCQEEQDVVRGEGGSGGAGGLYLQAALRLTQTVQNEEDPNFKTYSVIVVQTIWESGRGPAPGLGTGV